MQISPLWWVEGVSGDEWDVFYFHVGVELNDPRSNRDQRNEHAKRIKCRISLQISIGPHEGMAEKLTSNDAKLIRNSNDAGLNSERSNLGR